jgi:hypothetical protein
MIMLFLLLLLVACSCLGQVVPGLSVDLTVTNLDNDSYSISGNGTPGQVYNIQFADSVDSTNWQTLDQVQADTNGAFVFIDESISPQRFYRSAAAATISSMPAGFSPTNIPGLAYYWNFNDLPYNVATTGWTDRLQHVVLTNYNPSPYDPTNSALGLMLPNNGSVSDLLTNSTIAIGSNFTLWMVIRERLNLTQMIVPQYSCLFGSSGGPRGLMLANGVIGCDWGNGSSTIGGVMMTNQPIDLVYSQGYIYTNGVALNGRLPQPNNNFKFQTVGDIMPGGGDSSSPFIGYIQYIGIWTNTLFTAANVSNLDNWVNTNGVSNITSGLTAWWQMQDGSGTNLSDSSGNEYNGTIKGGQTWINTAPTGGGLTFNGTSTLVTTANVPNTWTNMSLVFWINSPSFDGSLSGTQAVPIGHSANKPNEVNGGPGWQAYCEDHYMRFLTLDAAGNYAEVANQYFIDNKGWHQCVLEIGANPASLIGYTDGEIVTSPVLLSGTLGSIQTNVAVTMGTVTDPVNGPLLPYFDGSLADVRIYTNHVLSAQEVADLFRWRGQP